MRRNTSIAIIGFGIMGRTLALEDGKIRSVLARAVETASKVAGGLAGYSCPG